MSIVAVVNVAHSYGSHQILDGVTLSIEPGEKIGLVGRNGQGKTTLMKMMTGELKPDSGSVQLQRNVRVGYLSQHPTLNPEETLRGEAEGAFAELHDLHRQLEGAHEAMAHVEGEALDKLLKECAVIETRMEAAGGYAIDHKIDAMLHGLGFTDEEFTIPVKGLSGGQKARVGLARLLLEAPDVLLMDEPTNHLDIEGRKWLEEFLAEEYTGAVVIVSHDRWLLDRVTSRIVEVERGKIREYPGNYHAFVEQRALRLLSEGRAFEKQQDKIKQEQAFIDRYKAGQRAKQARGRELRLERMKENDSLERPVELEVMKLGLPKAERSGDQVIVAEEIRKQLGERVLFNDFTITVMRGQRVGIIGPNGTGKTTLLKCLLGEMEVDAGSARVGSRLKIGYFKQTQDDIDMSLRVWEHLQRVIVGLSENPRASEQQARDLAGAFLFSGNDQEKVISMLSGGERARMVLAGLMASAKNLLVLDEPTNHLDIPSAERFEQVLSNREKYDGTLLVVSHDRALLESLCDQLIVFDGKGGVSVFEGKYSELVRKQKSKLPMREKGTPSGKTFFKQAASDANAKRESAVKAREGKPDRELKKIEQQITDLQGKIAGIDTEMLKPAVYSDGQKCKELDRTKRKAEEELAYLEAQWLERAESVK